jgi:exopolyphosphatase
MDKDDMRLRPENIFALDLCGIKDPVQALFLNTDLPASISPCSFALVDHNRLDSRFRGESREEDTVKIVVDHHEDEKLYPNASPRIIAPAGSCSSHISMLCPPDIPAELATLLLSAILIDTAGLKSNGKALDVDYQAVKYLLPRSTLGASISSHALSQLSDDLAADRQSNLAAISVIGDLYDALSARKFDLTGLGVNDLLRRDYKEYELVLHWIDSKPVVKAGLSTVPMKLSDLNALESILAACTAWMESRTLTILGVLTTFQKRTKKGQQKHRREMLWVIRSDVGDLVDGVTLASRLCNGIESSSELQLVPHSKFIEHHLQMTPSQLIVKVYKQGNAKATRKAVAPIMKQSLESCL